jgi:hypothetical protein
LSVIDHDDTTTQDEQHQDEKVLASLQHSLLCATLFESIRRELAPDTEDVGNVRTSTALSDVWLSSESEHNFLPPHSLLSGNQESIDLAPICAIHCHEGEVKVQLDCEYTLTVKLVEAGGCLDDLMDNVMADIDVPQSLTCNSGSQSAQQLMVLCRILLIDAQERFHKHSIQMAKERKLREENQHASVHVLKHVEPSPLILQHCCALGSKLLLEQRIRSTIQNVSQWLQCKTHLSAAERLRTEWLSLSLFDLQAQFTLSFRSWVIDCLVLGEELTITSTSECGAYKKVKFHSDSEFEVFLKLALQRLVQNSAG